MTAKLMGSGFDPEYEPLKPMPATTPPDGTVPFQDALLRLTFWPFCDQFPTFHGTGCTCWSPGNVNVIVQPLSGSPRLRSVMSAVKPVGHCARSV